MAGDVFNTSLKQMNDVQPLQLGVLVCLMTDNLVLSFLTGVRPLKHSTAQRSTKNQTC